MMFRGGVSSRPQSEIPNLCTAFRNGESSVFNVYRTGYLNVIAAAIHVRRALPAAFRTPDVLFHQPSKSPPTIGEVVEGTLCIAVCYCSSSFCSAAPLAGVSALVGLRHHFLDSR